MIIRNQHKKQFTKVETEIARNGPFRPEELGLYVAMLAHTDDWDFHEKALSRELNSTPEEIRGILHRLESKGFAVRRAGRYGQIWDLIEKPENRTSDPETPNEDQGASDEDIGLKLIETAKKMRLNGIAIKAARERSCRKDTDRV